MIDFKEEDIPKEYRDFSKNITNLRSLKYYLPKDLQAIAKKVYNPKETITNKELEQRGLTSVRSSNVAGIRVLKDNLIVLFNNGAMYEYKGASFHYTPMLNSISKGAYVWNYLRRTNVPYRRLSALSVNTNLDGGIPNGELDFRTMNNRLDTKFTSEEVLALTGFNPNANTKPDTF